MFSVVLFAREIRTKFIILSLGDGHIIRRIYDNIARRSVDVTVFLRQSLFCGETILLAAQAQANRHEKKHNVYPVIVRGGGVGS